MSEVRARTGTPPATVHHYLRLGLLPAPVRAARNRFVYDERHVQRLRLIRLLRDRRRLPLRAIADVLPELVELDRADAFRPEMWDRVVGRRLEADPRRGSRERLLDAAIEAFSRRGYAEVAVEDLCREVGLAKGSFYRHFASKEELFLAAAASAADQAAASSVGRRLPLFLELWARALQGRPGYRPAARRVLTRLAAAAGDRPPHAPDPADAGTAVLGDALARSVSVLETDSQPAQPAAT